MDGSRLAFLMQISKDFSIVDFLLNSAFIPMISIMEMKMPVLSLKSNPLWKMAKPSPWDLLTHHGELQPGTLWQTDENGFKSPTNGRSITPREQSQLDEFNSQRRELNEAGRKAIDAVMERVLPLTDSVFKEITDDKFRAISDDISWLHDHPAGSDFYTSGNNGWMPNPDEEGDWRLGRLERYLKEAGLEVDLAEIPEKVAGGISTPIVIDLGGDGIKTTSLFSEKTVSFDIDGDGKMDKSAWINGDDAFLAVDRNGNGIIDGLTELFGGRDRGAGFSKLAEFDSNGDGMVDKNDERYSELLLWQDLNMNGKTESNELRNAETAGLESISLDYTSQDVWENGNLLGEVSSAIFQGKKIDAIDVSFRFKKNHDAVVDELNDAEIETSVSAVSNSPTFEINGNFTQHLKELINYSLDLTNASIDHKVSSAPDFLAIEFTGVSSEMGYIIY